MAMILVTEDRESVRQWLVEALERRGHQVVPARTGVEGIAHLRRAHYDVVVADMELPGMSGLDVVRMAKRLQPDVRVILVTSCAPLVGVEVQAGGLVDRWVPLPAEPEELSQAVEELLRSKERGAAHGL